MATQSVDNPAAFAKMWSFSLQQSCVRSNSQQEWLRGASRPSSGRVTGHSFIASRTGPGEQRHPSSVRVANDPTGTWHFNG